MSLGKILLALFSLLLLAPIASTTPAAAEQIAQLPDTLRRPAGAVVIPEKFLRRWDPVTIFFDRDTGPASGGAEDNPARYVTLSPAHPGGFTWLDARTLQFRPAEPWPPLTRFDWKIAARQVQLITLLPSPNSTIPANGATGLADLDSITLTMPEPIDPGALAAMVTIDLTPLPGVGLSATRTLDSTDFDVKALERAHRGDAAVYVLHLHEPIAGGTTAVLHLRQSPDAGLDGVTQDIQFATAAPFRVSTFGCSGPRVPVTPSGVTYPVSSALRCRSEDHSLMVQFSAPLGNVDPVAARNLVHIAPPVNDLSFRNAGAELVVTGSFLPDTLYTLRLEPTIINDRNGRSLQMAQASEVSVFFPALQNYLRWQASQGIVERFGPQMAPLQGRGFDRVDLRIYPVDPLNRTFWPFPDQPIATDERVSPPGPGEQPRPIGDNPRMIDGREMAGHLRSLGSPAISEIVNIPLRKAGTAARFGLDLKPYLERVAGQGAPGTYLVGIRRMDASAERSWMRLQVTDLSLTTVEEPHLVHFFVTSIASGAPVAGAKVRFEGVVGTRWVVLGEGETARDGKFTWRAPGPRDGGTMVRRLVVDKSGDTLVLDPAHPPPVNGGSAIVATGEHWLQWTVGNTAQREQQPETLCHIFTERPIYRPDEPVHVKAWIRSWKGGTFTPFTGKATLVVTGEGDVEWRYPLELTPEGTAYYKFDEKTAATGDYETHVEIANSSCGSVTFKKEAYKLPRFEVQLHAPRRVGLDAPFSVDLAARYYAGGSVTARPVRWRVTQFSYDWQPERQEGFVFSSDARFSSLGEFRSTPVLERESVTDDDGNLRLVLDPTIEPTAQPRRYLIEATVVGEDDQTVTASEQVLALPPFALGVKVPRFLEKATTIDPEIIAIGPDGNAIAGQEITARLLRRQWHSTLQATDFSQGVAKYVTDVEDEKITETKITGEAQAKRLSFAIDRAGVYVVQLEAQDRTGRTQKLAVDLFANGDTPLTWQREPAKSFAVTSDKPAYAPGETATLVLQSPYQTAQALAVIEHADNQNSYQWVDVKNGVGRLKVEVPKKDMPHLRVHFALMRGRVSGSTTGQGTSLIDLARPATVTNLTTLTVTPVQHQVKVEVRAPERAQPSDEIALTVNLRDEQGKPLAGEVTLWLVDQAVLALAPEQPLNPLPDFIVEHPSRLVLRDTRNLTLGLLPLQVMPGGDEGKKKEGLLDQVPIRKNFTPVPYYNPRLLVGPDGTAIVNVKLPDSLTNFMVRAKAVSGPDRFGFGVARIAVRLPVIVEPALPRFVRPGDRFTVGAIGRIVEGGGGPGRSEIRVDGLSLQGPATQSFDWGTTPTRLEAPVEVPSPGYTSSGRVAREAVTVTLGVERTADKAHDAFAVTLPIRPDRQPIRERRIVDLRSGEGLTLPAFTPAYRPGTLKRTLTVTAEPALLRLAAGLDYLRDYAFGCTEQRVSEARAEIAARRFRDTFLFERPADRTETDVATTITWIKDAIDNNGLVAFWPGSKGNVALTAWTVEFLVEARDAGFTVDKDLLGRLTGVLRQSLRSDYPFFLVSGGLAERSWALAALAEAGELDAGYAAELTRRSSLLTLESRAEVIQAIARGPQPDPATRSSLQNDLWSGIVFRLVNGTEAYGGLQTDPVTLYPSLLPSETRVVAAVIRATKDVGNDPRRRLLVDALVASAGPAGWGSTNANAEAFLALSDYFGTSGGATQTLVLKRGTDQRSLQLEPARPVGRFADLTATELTLTASGGAQSLAVLTDQSYLPLEDGSKVAPLAQGFAVAAAIKRVDAGQATRLDQPGQELSFAVGDVVEQTAEVVNPSERHQIAIVVPLAAGMEPLNPNLATAPPEAKPSEAPTLAPTYVAYLDDQVAFFYDLLPPGTYRFAFRTRATVPGRYSLPPASAEMMYDGSVHGNAAGAEVIVERR